MVFCLKEPVDLQANIAPHIVSIVTRTVGVLLVKLIKEVVDRERKAQLLPPAECPFRTCFDAKKMVGRRREINQIAGRIKAPLFCDKAVAQTDPRRSLSPLDVAQPDFLIHAPRGNVGQISPRLALVGPN